MIQAIKYRIDFKTIKWYNPSIGVKMKSYIHDNKQIRLVEFTKEFIEPDWCLKGHIGYVLEGELEINFSGNKIRYNAGNGIFIPPGSEHKHMAEVISDTVRLILIEDV